jgi:hypothetical protein
MKTRIATLVFIVGMFFVSTTFANEPVPASKAVHKSVAKQIQKELEYPDFAIDEKFECIVLVRLTILDDGSFDVELANCVSKRIKEYVTYEIEHMTSEEHAQYAGQTVHIKLKFDLKLV